MKMEGEVTRRHKPDVKKILNTVNDSAQAITPINDVKEPAPPHKNNPGASSGQKSIRELVQKKNGTLHPGQRVKHNGPHSSPFFGKVGEIMDVAADGQIRVNFGESSTWLQPYIVMVVPGAPV